MLACRPAHVRRTVELQRNVRLLAKNRISVSMNGERRRASAKQLIRSANAAILTNQRKEASGGL